MPAKTNARSAAAADRPPVNPADADTFTRGEPAREGEAVFMRLPQETRKELLSLCGLIWEASMLSACVADGVKLAEVERFAPLYPKETAQQVLKHVAGKSDRYAAAEHLATVLSDAETVAGTINV